MTLGVTHRHTQLLTDSLTRCHVSQVDEGNAGVESLGAPPPGAFPSLGAESAPAEDSSAFPTLGAAAKAPAKKSKGVKLSLAEFAGSAGGGGSSYAPPGRSGGGGFGRGGDDIVLPSGPRIDRPEGEEERRGGGLGGGFKEYGGDRYGGGDREGGGDRYGDRGGRGGDRYGDREERRGGGRYDRDDRRGGGEYDDERGEREEQGPSRADMSSNWGSDRRAPPQDDRYAERGDRGRYGGDRYGEREERRGGFEFSDRPPREELGPSRADETDNWNKDKRPVERDSRYEERPVRDDRDRDWGSLRSRTRAASPPPAEDDAPRGERPKLQLKPRSETAASSAGGASSSLFGGAKPVDVKYVDDKPREAIPAREERAERAPRDAAPSDGDRWGSSRKPAFNAPRKEEDLREATPEERAARPKLNLSKRSSDAPVGAAAKSSLFGGARPREEALKEAGRDAALEDLKLSVGGVKRREFKEEKELKAKIADLKAAEGADLDEIKSLELQLTKMSLEFDDKFRFAKNAPPNKSEKKDDDKKDDGDKKEAKDVKPRVVHKPAEPAAPVVAANAFSALAAEE